MQLPALPCPLGSGLACLPGWDGLFCVTLHIQQDERPSEGGRGDWHWLQGS